MSILEVKDVVKILNKKQILKKISFNVNAWEIYWFLWPNWAGKTTTMKCIMWLIEPEEGEIIIFWKKWLTIESKNDVWFMPENTYLYRHLTWEEFLRFNWKFFNLWWDKLDKKVKELLKRVWLENDWKTYLKDYSKWMLQRVWLAQSIINDPKLVFLDEPMSWLDPIWRKMVKDLIVELKSKWTTIFFNTHILADVESICDRVSIIHKWNIIVEWQKVSEIGGSLENFFIEKVENN
jgi:ABC-2 type transport system ATP-binding protein